MIDPVRPIAIEDIEQARARIAGTVLRTPLVRLDTGGGPDIRLKLENLQPTNAYKIRGATNAVASLSDEQRARGVWTISAGNAGQGVAYAARQFGIPCTVVAIETAPQTKLERMRALGATIVPVSYDRAWVAAETHEYPGLEATFVHPFDNHDFIAGHGTMGLEIIEDCPDVATVICAIGGGGLITGVGSAIKAREAGRESDRRRAGNRGPLRAVAARGRPTQVRRLAGVVCRWRRRQERHRAHVAAHAASDRRCDHGNACSDPRRDAPDRRKITDYRRRRGRASACRGADRSGGRGANRLRGLGRQYRPGKFAELAQCLDRHVRSCGTSNLHDGQYKAE